MNGSWPKEIFVYECERATESDAPILAVATSVKELPYDIEGDEVAVFRFDRKGKLRVVASLEIP